MEFYNEIEREVGCDNIILTGHSLGGTLAAYVSICTGARAYAVDGAVGHILDTTFWESYGEVHGFTGANDFNFVNLTDELGANSFLSDIGLDVGDIIQATKQNMYPMITYRSVHSKDSSQLNPVFSSLAGSHHPMSFLTYDTTTKKFSLGSKVKTFDCDSGWSSEILDYVAVIEAVAGGGAIAGIVGSVIGGASEVYFDHGRVQIGTTRADTIKAPTSTAILGMNKFVENHQFGGTESDKITGYSASDIIVPGRSGNSSEILDGQGGSDVYIIDAECRSSTINDPSGDDIIILRGWEQSNISMQDIGEYVRISDSERVLLVNKHRSFFSWGKISVYWVNKTVNKTQQVKTKISADLFADVQNSRYGIQPYAIQTSGSDQVPVRLIQIEGIADVAVYDSNKTRISDDSFTNKGGDNTVYTDYAYYYGYNNAEDDDPYAVIYLFNDGYTIEATGNGTVSASLYQYNETENELTDGSIVQDVVLTATKSLAIVSDGTDEGYYVVEDGSASKIEDVDIITYAQSVSLSQSAITLKKGDSATLSVVTTPAGASAEGTWHSSDESVVSIDKNGVLSAHKQGNAIITFITLNGKTTDCKVTVVSKGSTSNDPNDSDNDSGYSSSDSDGSPSYSIAVSNQVTGGTVKVTPTSASKDQRITITVEPSYGYELKKLIATDSKGNELKLTDKGDGKFTFTMPNSKVDIEAVFQQIAPMIPFDDVKADAYYYDAVAWAVSEGITSGTSATAFSPDASCTRAQTVTFLWRVAGSPVPQGINDPFTDVQPDAYYYNAVLWAAENGITAGTSATTFSPDATVTRGQAVTFLHRAVGSPAAGDGDPFEDVDANAYYADAVRWAAEQGITSGTSATTFSPDGPCTRAQIVTFLYRNQKDRYKCMELDVEGLNTEQILALTESIRTIKK